MGLMLLKPFLSRRYLWVLLPAVLALPSGAHADIYRYVDANGVIHFRNTPGGGAYKLYIRTPMGKSVDKKHGLTAIALGEGSPERMARYDEWIHQAASLYQLPEELIRSVIMVESGYEPRAVSSKGAQGLMQLMPETALRMEVRDIFDPRENILGGVRYLRVLANLFNGDLELTLAAYNAGEGAVLRYGGVPPFAETQDYVVKVLSYYRQFRVAPTNALADVPAQ